MKFSIKPPPSDQRLPVLVIMYETCRNFLSNPTADNKNASKNVPGEAPFAVTPIKNRIFVIALKKLFIFEATKIWFWRSAVRVSE